MKYELVKTDNKNFVGVTLYRVKALRSFGNVSVGDLGGYIEGEKNLSHSGDAWVYGDARVYGNAMVYGDAMVSGDASVYGDSSVYGDAIIKKSSDYIIIGPAKSSGRFTTAFVDSEIGVRVDCGCFTGTVLEFSKQIEETHANNQEALEQYRLFCQLIAFNFGVKA